MRIGRLDDGGVTRLTLHGELDLDTGDLVEEQVTGALRDRPESLVLDLEGLTFCDSAGIDVLLLSREAVRRAGARFRVTRPRGIVLRSLEVTGLLEILTSDREPAGGRP
ncbi:STAS domain-containing protein [Actinoplanes sp. G11-F43]|uniref:STAS domain-containing protein n=1 Tax=Actinoplanes sp. G11-F43 TaxID=3424130 RepID=UPI003D342C34